MGPCCDDHRQPRMYGRSCSLGCTSPVLWHSVCADSSPGVHCRRILPSLCHSLRTVRRAGARRERTSLLSCKASCGQPIPKSVAATPPVIPCVRTAEPWIRRRRTLPSSCHSIRADNRARASSRTHLRPRARPPRVQTAQLRVHPRAPGHPHPTGRHLRRGHSTRPGACRPGRGHSTPSGTAIPSPNASPVPGRAGCPQPRRLSVGHPWHPEPLVRQLHQHRPPTTTSGPRTGARSGQAGEGAASSRGGEAAARGVRAPDPHRLAWLTPIPATQRVRRGPPGAPGYGHRPAPAHCAGGP